MDYQIEYDRRRVDWQAVADTLRLAGMSYHSAEKHQRAFEASHTTIFIYLEERLVGCGRALSDGEYQAALYDIAVLPELHGKGLGKVILQSLLERLPDCNIILYASPGMEGFYRKLGFGDMTTGMAKFTTAQAMKKFTRSK